MQLYCAARDTHPPRFTRLTTLANNVKELKFTAAGAFYQLGRQVRFVSKAAFDELLRKGRGQTSHEAVVDEEGVSLATHPSNCLLHELEADEVLIESDFFNDSMLLYVSKVSEARVYFAKVDPQALISEQGLKVKLRNIIAESPDKYGTITPGINMNLEQDKVRFILDTPFVYNQSYDFFVKEERIELVEEFRILGPQFDRSKFDITVVYAPALEGHKIPITLVHRKGLLRKDGSPTDINNPSKLLLKTYGCYGLNNHPSFELTNWSLLERNWIIAYAHIRGGSELGDAWHQSTLKTFKHRSVDDIISCCQFLTAENYTHPSLLCATSNSAGAGLLASTMNVNPSLFKAVHLSAPFLDIKGSLINPDLPLSQSDYQEFGNPLLNILEYDSISTLCPYNNVKPTEYPAVLISAFKDDYRTPLWNVLKYMRQFRETVKAPTRIKEFCDKNIALLLEEGSHLGNGDSEGSNERNAITTSFYEWIVEEKSLDLQGKKMQFKLRNLFK